LMRISAKFDSVLDVPVQRLLFASVVPYSARVSVFSGCRGGPGPPLCTSSQNMRVDSVISWL
jgi:hypothetical protein